MKKKIFNILFVILILIGVLFVLTACGDYKKEKSSNNVPYIGKETPQKLMKAFYEDEVRNGYLDKAKKYFNIEAMVTCELLTDMDLDFNETYDMMFNLDKGTKYIKENYKGFVKALKEEDIEFNDEIVKRLKEMKEEKEEEIDIILDNLTGKPDSYIDTVEKGDNYTDIQADNFYVYDVIIKYQDMESTDTNLDVWIVKINGKYYIATID